MHVVPDFGALSRRLQRTTMYCSSNFFLSDYEAVEYSPAVCSAYSESWCSYYKICNGATIGHVGVKILPFTNALKTVMICSDSTCFFLTHLMTSSTWRRKSGYQGELKATQKYDVVY